jgi:hypothetical protein
MAGRLHYSNGRLWLRIAFSGRAESMDGAAALIVSGLGVEVQMLAESVVAWRVGGGGANVSRKCGWHGGLGVEVQMLAESVRVPWKLASVC